ncbi:MAG: DUF4159 domain-containing protein [Acidobacteria bacterium]|nr:DUF4159 domain-containing protein [Acidobacteriota bacterium]
MSGFRLAGPLLVAGLALTADGAAQRPVQPPHGIPRIPAPELDSAALPNYDGGFRFCRVWFRSWPNGDGDGWYVDYPRADENLSIRFSELTKAPVTHDAEGNPATSLVRLTDPALFRCPFVMMSEPGGSYFSQEEAGQLRDYLLKGGFLWVDDFWGSVAWANWESQIRKAFPASGDYQIVDIPPSHTIFHTLFNIEKIQQIPNIGLWRNFRQTSERGADSATVHVRGILDERGRIMVLMTHNTDFGDAYEREAEMPDYFKTFSVNGYAVGVDVILYAMTH